LSYAYEVESISQITAFMLFLKEKKETQNREDREH